MTGPPAGLRAGPLHRADAAEAAALWRACELHDQGEAAVTEEDLVGLWQRPSFDFATRSVGVRAGEQLVAAATLSSTRHAFAHVLPAYRGRGIGTWVLEWTQEAARAAGADVALQTLADGARDAVALLEAHGYEARSEEWMLEIELAHEPAPPAIPAGYAIRAFRPDRDERAAYEVFEAAFGEWPEREPESFGDWAAVTVGRPGFSPDRMALACRGEEVVGAMLTVDDGGEGWVDRLAVAREHRGRGLGRGLLQHAFLATWRSGGRRCGLGTDARTGAGALYERAGMHVKRSFAEYAKPL